MAMSKNRRAVIGTAVVLVLLPLGWFGFAITGFMMNCDEQARLKLGMTRAQVRSELRFYRESTVDWRVPPWGRIWLTDDQGGVLGPRRLRELDVRSYRLLGIPGAKPIFVAYDKTGHLAAIQEYD